MTTTMNRTGALTIEYRFSVILSPHEGGGFRAHVPAFPEILASGDSEDDALRRAERAITTLVTMRKNRGQSVCPDTIPDVKKVTVAITL